MESNQEQEYYNELTKKYENVTKHLLTKLNYTIITFINTDLEECMSKSRLEIIKESKLSAIKNGFLRSYKLIDENPNLSQEDKERIFKKMVKSYFEICMKIINEVDLIVNSALKKEEKIKLIREYKHYE